MGYRGPDRFLTGELLHVTANLMPAFEWGGSGPLGTRRKIRVGTYRCLSGGEYDCCVAVNGAMGG